MTFQSTSFDMNSVINKLRTIAENGAENLSELDPGAEVGGQEIDNASFTRTMARLAAIKDAVAEENYNALRAGVRSLYMNRRPNLQQMTALMDLLETVLSYVAEDNALFQRLKSDLAQDKAGDVFPNEPASTAEPTAGTAASAPVAQPPAMRGMKV
jgi:hypothetical protein